MMSTSPSEFTPDEIEAAEALLLLSTHGPVGSFPRWTRKRKRSGTAVHNADDGKQSGKSSPNSPLSFSPSRCLQTAPPPPPASPLPLSPTVKPAEKADLTFDEIAKVHKQEVDTLPATKLDLGQSFADARIQFELLKEQNRRLLEQWQTQRTHEILVQQQQQQFQLLYGRPLHLFPVGPTLSVDHGHDPRQAAVEEAVLQQRAAECAQARKRRLELLKVKSSSSCRAKQDPGLKSVISVEDD